jgi:cardiolipin synthase
MADIWDSVASIAVALHFDRLEVLAEAVGKFASWRQFNEGEEIFGPGMDPLLVEGFMKAWAKSPEVHGWQISSALKAAARAAALAEAAESINLVWTGPKTGLIPIRKTEQAIREVIDESERGLFIVSYVFHNASSIVEGLNAAIERGVKVRILLESPIAHGGATSGDGLGAMHRSVPKAELYIWEPTEKAKTSGSFSASVHAKCAVADSLIAFVTSANLTSAAMERNMELGVLVRGGTTPARLHAHLNALVSTRAIVLWP